MPTPSVARMVHYVSYGTPGGEYPSVCRAATVTAVTDNNTVDLCVMNPEGLFFNRNVTLDEATKAGGTWHWPEIVSEPEPTIDPVVTSKLLVGINFPVGTAWQQGALDYPNGKYTRTFGKDNLYADNGVFDADSLTEPTKWGTEKWLDLWPGAVMHLSWKDEGELFSRFLDTVPDNLPADYPGIFVSPWHEPVDDVRNGALTLAAHRARGTAIVQAVNSHPKGWIVKGIGPILTRYDLDELNTNPADYGFEGMTHFGVDCYWQGTSAYPTNEQMFGTVFAKVKLAFPNVRLWVPEYGLLRTTADTTGQGRAQTMRTHVEYLRARGDVDAIAYFNSTGSIPGVPFAVDSPEADVWRQLQAEQ